MTKNEERIASPASSGGEGTYFEQHTNAYWLALLLLDAIPPIALDGTISKISFQSEHLGWSTDDVLVTSRTNTGDIRRLACQVKKSLTIGAANDEFSATIIDAWKDFNGTVFRENSDALAIVTQLGTNVVLRDFAGLLDCARASSTAADFEHRLTTPRFVNAEVRGHATVIEEILKGHEGGDVDRERIWRFLRHLYVLSLDLNTATSQTAAHVQTLLAHTATETDRIAAAAATWNELLAEVSHGAPKAQEYERTSLPPSVVARHAPSLNERPARPGSTHASLARHSRRHPYDDRQRRAPATDEDPHAATRPDGTFAGAPRCRGSGQRQVRSREKRRRRCSHAIISCSHSAPRSWPNRTSTPRLQRWALS